MFELNIAIIMQLVFEEGESQVKGKKKSRQVHLRVFLISGITITVLFVAVSYLTVNRIRDYFNTQIRNHSLNLAKSYSLSLSKAAEAYDIINELLEEKIMVASRAVALYDGQHSNELLVELARTLEVDEIYSYDSEGEIIYSNIDKYIGWKAYEGHPVHDFMMGDSVGLVEAIRADTESGTFLKYGYFRTSDGRFVQIGVLADKIHAFLDSFEVSQLLAELKVVGALEEVCFLDTEFNVLATTDEQLGGKCVVDDTVKEVIVENREYGYIGGPKGGKEYTAFVPVYLEGDKIGALAIVRSLRDTEAIIRVTMIDGLISLGITYLLLIYIIVSAYGNNRKLVELVYYDVVTGLPNREHLKEFLAEKIEKTEASQRALFLLNCNFFHVINLAYGYEYGDTLLKEIAKRIQGLMERSTMLFRFSSDGFIVFVDNYNSREDLISIANRLQNAFDKPFEVNNAEQYMGVQIGIVEINRDYDSVDKLLKDASVSITNIKSDDHTNYIFFREVMADRIQRETLIEEKLREAVAGDKTERLYFEFQPQLDLRTDKIVCFEILVRMIADSMGIIPCEEFIDVAERMQLIVPLSNLIFNAACAFLRKLRAEGFDHIRVAVNVSGIHLLRDDFSDVVMNILQENGLDTSCLEIEITESVLLDNYDIINDRLKTLSEHGVKIALNDFGTGYSSFSRLGELNIDTLKLAQQLISGIALKGDKEVIAGEIISMAHKLGLVVVAEGVEHQAQKDYLIENECDIIQGYLFSRPLSEKCAIEFLKTYD